MYCIIILKYLNKSNRNYFKYNKPDANKILNPLKLFFDYFHHWFLLIDQSDCLKFRNLFESLYSLIQNLFLIHHTDEISFLFLRHVSIGKNRSRFRFEEILLDRLEHHLYLNQVSQMLV